MQGEACDATDDCAQGTVCEDGTCAGTGTCGAAENQLFSAEHPWNERVDGAQLDPESEEIINYLQNNHTRSDNSQLFRVDGPSETRNSLYGITILFADAATSEQTFTPTDDFYSPDCDRTPIPIPTNGAVEGETGYACTEGGDCHLLVIDAIDCRLYEMWRADRTSDTAFDGGCLAVWDLAQDYNPTMRGECCTSADAAGLPIAPLMFTADEIAAGVIAHAIRFILPNRHIRERVYVRPGTHATPATSGPASAPPYAARLRLRADFDTSGFGAAAQVVLEALKIYGMILADGGDLTFTAANDRFTTAKWADVGFGPNDLVDLAWTDFEAVDGGERYVFDNSCDCTRTPITE